MNIVVGCSTANISEIMHTFPFYIWHSKSSIYQHIITLPPFSYRIIGNGIGLVWTLFGVFDFELYMIFRFYMILNVLPASILHEHQVLYNLELCTSFRCDMIFNFTRGSNDMHHGISLEFQVTFGNLQWENIISTIQLCSLAFCEMFLMACWSQSLAGKYFLLCLRNLNTNLPRKLFKIVINLSA